MQHERQASVSMYRFRQVSVALPKPTDAPEGDLTPGRSHSAATVAVEAE